MVKTRNMWLRDAVARVSGRTDKSNLQLPNCGSKNLSSRLLRPRCPLPKPPSPTTVGSPHYRPSRNSSSPTCIDSSAHGGSHTPSVASSVSVSASDPGTNASDIQINTLCPPDTASADAASSSSDGLYAKDSLPSRLFETDRYPTKGRVNSYSKLQYLIDILSILEGTPELTSLLQSQFGTLFSLPVTRCSFSGKLVHNFLCRQIVSHNSHEIWFTYGGHPLRFSILEFESLTGLLCGPYPSKSKIGAAQSNCEGEAPYWYTLLGRNENPTVIDIVSILKNSPTMPGWKKLRLVLIIIVEGILLCGTQPIRPSFPIVEMVKDLEFFFNYPWGRHAFERTVRMLKVGDKVRSQSHLLNKLKQHSLAIHGFPMAIQLLLFKSIPALLQYLPGADDLRTFLDKPVAVLPPLKTFHSENILQLENSRDLFVASPRGPFSIEEKLRLPVTFDGDQNVACLLTLLDSGHRWCKADWVGGDASLRKLCICKGKRKERCTCGSIFTVGIVENAPVRNRFPAEDCESTEIAKLKAAVARISNQNAARYGKLKAELLSEMYSLLGASHDHKHLL
ncbi:hypothetical protein ISN44_As12g027110 [Arabidopsis suecica]|uniref:DUF1985 domain-containing protein n=1 Tax=Arabidopsis suecica TaxID=45249 RepID=A0A8T1YN13_ARASU|nr:hypothetical protein ISN44_As12g027110 [Arabidopsis suecica]